MKRNNTTIIIAVVALVALAGGGWYFYSQNNDSGHLESDTFINHLISGDTASAYAMYSPDMQAKRTQENFTSSIAGLHLDTTCHMQWTKHEKGKFSSGKQGKVDTGTLQCTGQAFDVKLDWAKYTNKYLLDGVNITIVGQPSQTQSSQPPSKGPSGDYADSDKFMGYLIAGKYDTAYAMMSSDKQKAQTKEEFATAMGNVGVKSSCTIAWDTHTTGTSKDGNQAKEDKGLLTCPGDTIKVTLSWEQFDQQYLVTRMNLIHA